MTREEIISGLKFTVEMFLLDPITGETITEPRNDMDKTTIDACKGAIELLEQEPRKGHWIEYSWNDNGLARWGLECDKCHKKYKYGGEIWNNPNYCPNCGAKMGVEDEADN